MDKINDPYQRSLEISSSITRQLDILQEQLLVLHAFCDRLKEKRSELQRNYISYSESLDPKNI
ncbi:hypothetical protein KDH_54920 [Dictyobacter sp. S3.2.2.5]|uniref:Uncharacterized protein n=1 Tax=Dictyobacter halimunensis TaxID=3026934 RepID=A0ABQ6FWM7_9CHLR|nr:hypothetical protein KDH_54920 [Dictyobacter sp. S3.2.2.5]